MPQPLPSSMGAQAYTNISRSGSAGDWNSSSTTSQQEHWNLEPSGSECGPSGSWGRGMGSQLMPHSRGIRSELSSPGSLGDLTGSVIDNQHENYATTPGPMTSLLMGQQEDTGYLAFSSRDDFFNDDSGFQAFQLPLSSGISSPQQSFSPSMGHAPIVPLQPGELQHGIAVPAAQRITQPQVEVGTMQPSISVNRTPGRVIHTSGVAPRGVLEDRRTKKPPATLPRTPPTRHRESTRSRVISIHSSDSEVEPKTKKRRAGRNTIERTMGTMACYSIKIRDCLEGAKDQFRLSICTTNTMPTSLESYDRARDAIRAEAIRRNIHDLTIDSHMVQLVNHEARNLRSDFKLAARTLVASFYKLFPADKSAAAATSELSMEYTKDIVSGLLDGDALWLNGVDKETGSVIPFQNSAVQALIIAVLHGGAKCLASRFPQSFGPQTPIPVILLACCALRCAIEEYEQGEFHAVDFTVDGFGTVYRDLVDNNIQVMGEETKFDFDRYRTAIARQGLYANSILSLTLY
ncbi:hypothetical protein FIBSPDRAFT_959438 [Athelia psychrophila]|uniref:DUF6532 domain-containing protein n=1 Tax=Athelia psychrophila TaxID=1759441 RepID=A0A166DI83_9AGAM|nr:hypothetical protein FIBSPDRAFT_959438 [Fibularhizoctonia sp. CBS 109695]